MLLPLRFRAYRISVPKILSVITNSAEPTGLEPETAADLKSVASVLQFFGQEFSYKIRKHLFFDANFLFGDQVCDRRQWRGVCASNFC
jgi:hypothetical protein